MTRQTLRQGTEQTQNRNARPASPAQLDFIRSLLNERIIPASNTGSSGECREAGLALLDNDAYRAGLGSAQASKTITWLLTLPKESTTPCQRRPRKTPPAPSDN